MAALKDDVLGIDFGAGEVKIALVRKFDQGEVSVVNYDNVALPPGTIEDGVIRNEGALVAALKDLKGRHDWGTDDANFSFVDTQAEFKVLELATGEEDTAVELRLTVQNAKDDEFRHLSGSDYSFDFVELNRDARKVRIQLAGQSAKRIAPYAKALRKAGFRPIACEPSSLAAARTTLVRRSRAGTRAVLDIGAEQTVFTCRQGTEVIYTRFINIGSQEINNRIVEALGCSWEEAEQLKLGLGFEVPPSSDAAVASQLAAYLDAVTMVFDALVGRLEAVQQDAERELGAIEGLTLTGGGARLKGLSDKLKHYLVVPIEELQSLPGFETASDFDIFTTALGLSAGPEMTLLPASKGRASKGATISSKLDSKANERMAAKMTRKRPQVNPLVLGLGIGLVLIAVMYYLAGQDSSKADSLVVPAAPVTTTQTTGYPNGDPVTNKVWTLLQQKQSSSFLNALNQMVLGVDNWSLTISPGSVSFSGEVKDQDAYKLMLTRQVAGFNRSQSQGGTVGRDGEVGFNFTFTPQTGSSSATTPTSTTTSGTSGG